MKNLIRIARDTKNSENLARMDKIIRNTKTPTAKELQAEAEVLYAKREQSNASLLEAYEDKKLKSKKLIKRARGLKDKAAAPAS